MLLQTLWTGEGDKYHALDGRDLPTRAVVVWNARDNTRQLLYRHEDAYMDVAAFDPAGKPWMFSGISEYPVYWYPDREHPLAQFHRDLVRRLPHEHVDIVNASDDLSTAVVRISSGARPTMFLVVDTRTGGSITGMHTYPKLRGRRISPVTAFGFTARDGLEIRGYLTTPLDDRGAPRSGAPLLVIAHDGPSGEFADYRFVADSRYDFERQLFASRGYAVLQVSTRGTGGRGAKFQQAGNGEWGRAVQDDFADAVRWAIKEGIAAAGHVCFYGTGHGAASALISAAREPGLFHCVIGLAGVYDLPRLAQDSGRQEPRNLSKLLPAPNREESQCFDMSQQIVNEALRPRNVTRVEMRKAIEAAQSKADMAKEIPPLLQQAVGNDLKLLAARSPVNWPRPSRRRCCWYSSSATTSWLKTSLTP